MENMKIQSFLILKGFEPHLGGFKFICYILENTTEREKMNVVYEKTASEYNTEPPKIERAIRHAKKKAGYEITNAHLIALLRIEFELNDENRK